MLRMVFGAALEPFPARNPVAAAAAFGLAAGIVLALSFWLFTDHAAVRRLRSRLWAQVLGLRLFGDEPALAWRILWGTVVANAGLLHALPPLLLAAPVVALMAIHLNEFFTLTPLQTGRDAVLTVRFRSASDVNAPVDFSAPPWITVNAPPVHIPSEREISWRLRATEPNLGLGRISAAGETVTQELDSRPGPRYSGHVRSAAWADALLHPAERRLPDGPVERVWISPLPAPLTWAGVTMDWKDWFAAVASVSAWVLSIPLARVDRPRLLHFLFHRL